MLFKERTLGAMEVSGDVDALATDDDDLLALQQLLGHGRCQTTEQMAFTIDDDRLKVVRNDYLRGISSGQQ